MAQIDTDNFERTPDPIFNHPPSPSEEE